jgi:SAM-dependent methyltransferase
LVDENDPAFHSWLEAQKEEARFWTNPKVSFIGDWQGNFARCYARDFSLYFEKKDVLEIGAGPHGIIYKIPNAKSRVALEPMDMPYIDEEKRQILVKGTGEQINLPDKSFDVVILLNVLDHCIDPPQVIREARRVLRDGGEMLLWIHCLRSSYKWLRPMINAIDRTHPYHFTLDEVKDIVRPYFQTIYEKTLKGVGTKGKVPEGATMKVRLAHYITAVSWLVLKKE